MALKIKTSITPNQSTKEVTLADITGVYNSVTNPEGYGAGQEPTGYREIGNIGSANWYIVPFNDTFSFQGTDTPTVDNIIYSFALDVSAAQDLADGTPLTSDLSSIIEYEDGIYKSLYMNWFFGEDVLEVGPATNQFLWNGNVNTFTNASFIKVYYGGPSAYIIYDILSVDTVNTTVTVNGLVPQDLVSAEYEVGFLSTVYFQNVHDINKCLHSDTAKTACSDCGCNKTKKEKLYTAIMDFFGIQPNIDRGNYKCANEIIDSITIYCSKSGCNC